MSTADASAFVRDTFDALLLLLEDARDHIGGGMGPEISPASRMRAAQELSRLTNRATAAMSLLLMAKALEEGQDLGGGDLAARAAGILADIGKPANAAPAPEAPVPAALTALVERGDALFARMPRVHDHVRSLLAGGVHGS